MSKNGKSLNFEAVYIRECGESWCDATIEEDQCDLGGDILRGEKNLSHGDYSHYVAWHKDL